MRSLFHGQNKNTHLTPFLPAPDMLETAPRHWEDGTEPDTCGRRPPSRRQQMVRRRRLAIVVIAASLLLGCRWHVANREPAYPVGEGVYVQSPTSDSGVVKHPNAAVFYMAATDAFHVDIPRTVTNGSTGLLEEPLSVQRTVLAQAQPAFALLRQGMRYEFLPNRSRSYFMTESPSIGGPLQPRNFAPIRELSRLLVVESRVREAEGDASGALQSSLDAMRLGVDCGQGRSLLDGMVGVLSQSIGAREALRHVDKLSAAEARNGALRLEAMLKRERSVAQMMTDERDTVTYSILQSVFRTQMLRGVNPSTGDLIDLQGAPWRFALGAVIFAHTKQGIVDDFAKQHDEILVRMKMPYQLARRLDAVPPSANPVVRYWIDYDFGRMHFQSARQSAQNRVLLTQLAVQAYRREHKGNTPASLSELTTGPKPYLCTVPTDPFSLTGGHTLRYRSDTGSAYSVGDNGFDDNNSEDDNLDL